MKTIFRRIVGLLAIATLLGTACTREKHNDASEESPSVTIGTEHLSAVSVVLKGKASLGNSAASDLQVGFQYSRSAGILPSNSTTVEATDADAEYNYTASLTGLEPATTYFFRSLIRQNGQDTYGETMSFTTKEVASMLEPLEPTSVEGRSATLNARLDLTDVLFEDIAYGFLWGTDESALDHDYVCPETKGDTIQAALTGLSYGMQYWYRAYVTLDGQTLDDEVKTFTAKPFTAVPGEAVDLGLSVKWSSTNLGAMSPEDYGEHFAWGEVIPKNFYGFNFYQWSDDTYTIMTKYNTSDTYGPVDGKAELKDYDYEDDAARQALGGQWRIPTHAECDELLNGCTWIWTTQNGVNGRLVTSNVNGNSIFLPAAGFWIDDDFRYAGALGIYWSSYVRTDKPGYAWTFSFDPDDVGLYTDLRYHGYTVRPVTE